MPESLGSTRRGGKTPIRRQSRRQAGPPVDKALHIRNTRVLTGPKDHLRLSPVVYNRKDVVQRASEVQQETAIMDVDDAELEVFSPYLSFCIGDGERSFTILHGDSLNRIPGPPVKQRHLLTRFVDPELLHGCYWSINAIPYMGFLPINPYGTCFNDSLFACVFERKWEVPTEMNGENWQLTAETVKQWQHLEKILIWLRDLIAASLPRRGSQEHLPAPLPSYYRFHRPIRDPTTFAKRLMRARYAFLLLGAEISFLYAIQANQVELVEQVRERIRQEFKLEALVDAVFESWMFIPSNGYYRSHGGYGKQGCPRHGMFVDVAGCTMAHALVAYETFRVPVWFWWGNRLHTHTPKSAFITRRFGFNTDMVRQFLASRGGSEHASEAGRLFVPIHYKRKHDQRPSSRPIQFETEESRFAAFPGEQWFEFMARRDRVILAWPVERSAGEQVHVRQLDAQSHGFDRRSSLFCWMPGRGTETLVRRRVPAFKATRVWGEYRPNHRVYNAFFDEWDLCEQFTVPNSNLVLAWEEHGSEVEVEAHKEVVEAASSPDIGSSCSIAATHTSPEQRIHDHGAGAFEADGRPPDAAKEPPLEVEPPECSAGREAFPSPKARLVDAVPDVLEVVMFTPPHFCDTDNEDGEVIDVEQKRTPTNWKTAYAELRPASNRGVYTRTVLGLPSCLEVVRDFYGLYVPPEFLLLKEDHRAGIVPPPQLVQACLRKFSCSDPPPDVEIPLTVEALTALSGYCDHVAWYSRGEALLAQPAPTCVCSWSDLDDAHPHFVLRDNALQQLGVQYIYWRGRQEHSFCFNWPERSLQIMVFRASDLLWVLRERRTKSLEDILLSLAARGIRFSLTVVDCAAALPMDTWTPPIPWRSSPFRANSLDFADYLQRRARFFSSTAVLRAALMSGGILWRLAMEHCPDPELVLSCTKEYVEQHGGRSCDSSGRVICEISLSESEIDVIVGTYIVGRTYPPSARKDLEISWFPRKIDSGGFNVGFWTEVAEGWYQARIQHYLNGTAQPETQKGWRNSLKLYRTAQRFSKGYDVLARRKLAEMAEGVIRTG